MKEIIPTSSLRFRPNHSINQCINYLINEIYNNKRNKTITGIIFHTQTIPFIEKKTIETHLSKTTEMRNISNSSVTVAK